MSRVGRHVIGVSTGADGEYRDLPAPRGGPAGRCDTPRTTDRRSDPVLTDGPCAPGLRGSTIVVMEIARLVDSDQESLARRVAHVTAGMAGAYVVMRCTLWYTARPPVYTAVVREA